MQGFSLAALGPPFAYWGAALRRSLPLLAGAILGAAAMASAATAQQAIIGPPDAVVTGFSGVAPGAVPQGADPLDYLTIAPDGPSARVVDLSTLGAPGTLTRAPKPFTVTAAQVGQVFGVALDDARTPSIYLAATSAYGLSIGTPDAGGAFKRLHHGMDGAQFLPSLFGPASQGGSPASIWRVDGASGQVTLFANLGRAGDNVAAGLGGLAFDPRSQQIFAADRATGLIHRLGLDGRDNGQFDHGVSGRTAGGLSEVPFAPSNVDIAASAFDTEQPASWGYAEPERLVFALAVHADRLYYSVAAGPEIWSVGIAQDGGFANDPRFELSIQTGEPGIEIASIAFDNHGLLYAAERAAPTGAYDFRAVAQGGNERVLRFKPKVRPDNDPGLWLPQSNEYAIGMADPYRNADGGVALGRGYDRSGRIQPSTCGVTLWTTGERLLGNDPQTDPVDGLQGTDTQLVLPANAPPSQSSFIDYDDRPGDPQASGLVGAVATLPCGPAPRAAYVPPPAPLPLIPLPPPPQIVCPFGTYLVGGACLLPPSCPPGTGFRDGYCVAYGCPRDMVRIDGRCVRPPRPCGPYETFNGDRCVSWECPRNLVRLPNGYCGCPRDEIYDRGVCRPPRPCPPGMMQGRDGRCLCPPDLRFRDGRCVPPPRPCPPGTIRDRDDRCVPIDRPCPPGQIRNDNGRCVPIDRPCPPGQVRDDNGRCVPVQRPCPPGQVRNDNGRCVPIDRPCPPGQVRNGDGRCVPIDRPCPPGRIRDDNGRCVPVNRPCPPGQVKGPNDACVPIQRPCPRGQIRDDNGRCVFPLKPVRPIEPVRPIRPIQPDQPVKPLRPNLDRPQIDRPQFERPQLQKPQFERPQRPDFVKPDRPKLERPQIERPQIERPNLPKFERPKRPEGCPPGEVSRGGGCVPAIH